MEKESRYSQAERHQDERRVWHKEAMNQYDESSRTHNRMLWVILSLRPIIEFAILIVLILMWRG